MSARNPVDYYDVLGVPSTSTFAEIRKAFIRLSLLHHPDRHDKSEFEEAHKEFVLISSAYDVLKDKESREEYDSARAHRVRKRAAAQRGNAENHRFHFERKRAAAQKGNAENHRFHFENGENDSKHREPRFSRDPRFYTDQDERRASKSQRTRNANWKQSKKATNCSKKFEEYMREYEEYMREYEEYMREYEL